MIDPSGSGFRLGVEGGEFAFDGDGPWHEDAEHEGDAGGVSGMPQFAQGAAFPEDGDDDTIEKQQVRRAFGEQAEAEPEPRQGEREPRRRLFAPQVEPEGAGHSGDGDIERLDFGQPAF